MDRQTVVHFHIGRGGRFRNGGYKTFKGVEDMKFQHEYCSVIDTDEDGNPLPEDEWTLIENASVRVLLEGKDAIMSRTGRIEYDDEYDTDIFKFVEDCNEDEIELLQQAIDSNSIEAMDLTTEDIEYINEWR